MVVAQRGFLSEITQCSNFESTLTNPNSYDDKFIDGIKTGECHLEATVVCVCFGTNVMFFYEFQKGNISKSIWCYLKFQVLSDRTLAV